MGPSCGTCMLVKTQFFRSMMWSVLVSAMQDDYVAPFIGMSACLLFMLTQQTNLEEALSQSVSSQRTSCTLSSALM